MYFKQYIINLEFITHKWGYSSVGRAPALHAGGRRFDSVYLHQTIMLRIISERKRKRLRVQTGYDPAITKVIALLQLNRDGRKFFSRRQVDKSIGWMPWRRKAMKDVVSCEKPRGEAKHSVIRGFLNGETRRRSCSVAGT